MKNQNSFHIAVENSIETKKNLLKLEKQIKKTIQEIYKSIKKGGKLFFYDNDV